MLRIALESTGTHFNDCWSSTMFNTKFSRWHLRFKIKCCRKAKEHNFWRKKTAHFKCHLRSWRLEEWWQKAYDPLCQNTCQINMQSRLKALWKHTLEKRLCDPLYQRSARWPMIKLSDQTHSSLHETHKELICFVIIFCWTWCVSMTNSCNNGLCQEHPGVALQVSQRGRLDIIELTLVRFLTQNKNACNEGCHVKSLQIYPQRISVLGGGQQ